jgi:hypothetical protein
MPDPISTLEKPDRAENSDDIATNLIRMLYVSQVYSAEAFGYVLETFTNLTADQKRKFEACRLLEITVSQRLLRRLTDDLSLTIRPPSRARQAAASLAPPRDGTWFDYMTELEAAATRGIQGARALKTLYQTQDANLCATLLASRMALRDFARDELDGQTQRSLHPILALLSSEDRSAVAAVVG